MGKYHYTVFFFTLPKYFESDYDATTPIFRNLHLLPLETTSINFFFLLCSFYILWVRFTMRRQLFFLGFICDFSQPSLVMDIVRGIDPTCVFMVSGSLRHLKVLVFGSQSKSVLLTSWKRSWFGAKIRVNAWVLSIFFCLVTFVLDDKYRGIGFAWNTDRINKNGNEYNWWIDKYR